MKITSSEQYLIVSSQKVFVLSILDGTKHKVFSLHANEVTCLLCVPRPKDFVAQNLAHKSFQPLKKTLEGEPGIVNFSFVREKLENAPNENVEEKKNDSQNQELDRIKQANSILYRLWVEHCT